MEKIRKIIVQRLPNKEKDRKPYILCMVLWPKPGSIYQDQRSIISVAKYDDLTKRSMILYPRCMQYSLRGRVSPQISPFTSRRSLHLKEALRAVFKTTKWALLPPPWVVSLTKKACPGVASCLGELGEPACCRVAPEGALHWLHGYTATTPYWLVAQNVLTAQIFLLASM